MKTLVVGGTGFLGGAITRACQAAGHEVTVLSRGRKPAPEDAAVIEANRLRDLSALQGRCFEQVFDTCAYTPGGVRRLLEPLRDGLRRYVMVSSISVYGDCEDHPPREDDAVPGPSAADVAVAAAIEAGEDVGAAKLGASYGPLKRGCEMAAQDMLGERAILLRAGLLIGPGDYTDRMTWWVRRIDEGGTLPLPLPKDRPLQAIDIADAAAFALKAAQDGRSGIFNLTGPVITLSALVAECRDLTGAALTERWLAEKAFTAANVTWWSDLPLCLEDSMASRHFLSADISRAEAAGLSVRPLRESLARILAWDRTRRSTALSCGMTFAQEAALLATAGQ